MKFTISNDVNLYKLKGQGESSFAGISLTLNDGILRIKLNKGFYSWDGCSPKFKLFGKEFGTWDGKLWDKFFNRTNPILNGLPETYYASLVHDFIYQSKGTFTRKEADALFKELLEQQKFKYTTLYYFFVRMFGWIWWIT